MPLNEALYVIMKVETPMQLQSELIKLFPSIEEEFYSEEVDTGYEMPLTYHSVWLDFSPFAHDLLSSVGRTKLEVFCSIINSFIDEGGDKENAVSTCLLEHSSRLGFWKLIKPFLNIKETKGLV